MIAWTAPETERLRVLVAQGLSASQIATRLCVEFDTGRSRNSVVAKVDRGNGGFGRLGRLPARKSGPAPRPHAGRNPGALAPARAAKTGTAFPPRAVPVATMPAVPKLLPANLPAPLPVTFLEAMFADRCLHFMGDPLAPSGPDMPVCGAERAQEAPFANRYCARHRASQVAA